MPNLSTTIHTYLTTAPTSGFYGQDVTVLEEWRGANNLLWRVACRGEETVLKLFLDAGQARSRRQFDGQQRFAPLGLAPRPRWYDRYPVGLARQVLVYDWAPGHRFDPTNETTVLAVAAVLARVHGSDPGEVMRVSPNPINLDYIWRMLRTSITQIDGWLATLRSPALQQAFGQTAGAATARINRSLPLWDGAPPAPVHGDLMLENIVVSFGSPVLVDWELFGLGDPAQEAAGFLLHTRNLFDPALRARWLETYLAGMAQPGLAERTAVYLAVLPFQNLCRLLESLRRHADEPKTAPAEADEYFSLLLASTWQESNRALDLDDTIESADLAPIVNGLTPPA
jgi:Ser/Thr protein kinase RdoA (MazF antagonist)